MKASAVVGIAVVASLALAEQGRSCSTPAPLGPTEPRALVAEADAAFTGTLVAVGPANPGSPLPAPTSFTFAVEEWFKGDLGDRVEATGSLVGSGGCGGLDGTIGRRGSYLLARRGGEWGLAAIAPELLRRGVSPWPRPDGVGRPAFVAGGHFGLIRTAVLDARGRTLAYGVGRGAVTALSVCPGRTVTAELVRAGESVRFALRELPSLRLLRESELRAAGFGETVVCRSRTGSDVIAGVVVHRQPRSETQLVRITSVGSRILERAPTLAAAVRGQEAVVSLSDGRLLVRDLVTGARRVVLRTPLPLRGLSVSSDGRFLAGLTTGTLVVVDLLRRTTRARHWRSSVGQTRWTRPRALAVWSRGGGGLLVVDPNLRRLDPASAWRAHTTTHSGSGFFGVDWSGRFLTERESAVVALGEVFSAAVSVLEPIRAGAR